MKKIIKFIFVLSVFNLSAKVVYRCCGPYEVCSLRNFQSREECMRLCGGSATFCNPYTIDELEQED